jgi:hypothetical protein
MSVFKNILSLHLTNTRNNGKKTAIAYLIIIKGVMVKYLSLDVFVLNYEVQSTQCSFHHTAPKESKGEWGAGTIASDLSVYSSGYV